MSKSIRFDVTIGLIIIAACSQRVHAQPTFGFDVGNTVSIGVPQFSTTTNGPDNINLGNLNVSWQFPIFSKPGRGIPFSFALAYNNTVWKQTAVNNFSLSPVANLGWSFVGNVPSGAIASNVHTAVNCNSQRFLKTDTYNNFVYADSSGIHHRFTTARYVINNCTGIETFSGPVTADDGSGFLLSPTSQASAIVTTPSGIQLVAFGPLDAGNKQMTDVNGNTVGGAGSNAINDTLGMTAVTVSSTFRTTSPFFPPVPGGTPAPGSVSFTYTDPNGTPETVVLNYGVFNVQSAFGGCNGLPDVGPFAASLATSLVYPDGTSY